MLVRFAVLAEFASVTQDGKVNVLGILDRLFAYRFPAVHRDLYVVNSLVTEDMEPSTHEIVVSVIDADGKTLAEAGGRVETPAGKQVLNQIHVFQDLQFPAAGTYEVNLFMNGSLVQALDLELVEIPPPDAP